MTRPLALAAGVTTLLVLVTAWPAGARAVAHLPGGAALRDSQRLLVPLVLLVALGFGALAERACAAAGAHLRPAVTLLVLLPVAALPSLAWGVSGRLHAVAYPGDYATVARLVDGQPGGVAVLPLTPYRAFGWNGGRTVLEPLPRVLDRPTVIGLDLPVLVGGRLVTVRGEDRLAGRLTTALADGSFARVAARAGIGWVVLDAPTPAPAGLQFAHRGRWLTLYRVPGVRHVDVARPYAAPAAPVIVGDVLAVIIALGAALRLLLSRAISSRVRVHGGER